MRIRTLLVPVDGSEATTTALDASMRVAHELSAHVDALHVRTDAKSAVPLLGEGMSGAMIEEMIDLAEREATARAERAYKSFEKLVETHKLPIVEQGPSPDGGSICWVDEAGREDEITAHRGRLADLTVVPRPTADSDLGLTMILNAAVFESGGPVLVVPPNGMDTVAKRIAVFWNGSAEAARAVATAMAFVERAEMVSVFTLGSDKTPAGVGEELKRFLGWHDVKAETRVLELETGRSPSQTLLEQAGTYGADLLVMGAYTRGRFRQLILGGVTRHVLEHATLPVLMTR